MNDDEKRFFNMLTEKREKFADQLDDPDYQGVKTTVVDKYSDQAHFVYELLQNADDAKATNSKFILKESGIYFYHNGDIHFTISDPYIKQADRKQIGHINAITAIGNSNKEEKSNTIGKFGVGFKSVFQYTDTPHIYDVNFQFKIERFIVPKLLDDDIQRDKNDTAFYLPFDKKDINPQKAYFDILEKLKNLVYPTLFLSYLKEVEWVAGKESGTYLMETKTQEEYSEIVCNSIEILNEVNQKNENEKLWLFKRSIKESEHKISIGFFLDENDKLKPVDFSAFCFFPTKESTKLKFIIHAPFLLTDSRESIKAGEKWNIRLIEELSNLAADSLLVLKEKSLIDDNIINIIPYRSSDFVEIENRDKISFKPFYNVIMEKLKSETLLPARNGQYADKAHAYWAEYGNIVELYSDEQLSDLMNNGDVKIVFPALYENNISRGNKDLSDYIKDITNDIVRATSILQKITAVFIKKQYDENKKWLYELYEYLSQTQNYYSHIKQKPIFIDKNCNAASAFDEKNQLLFPPTPDESEYNTIHKDFLKSEIAMKFFEMFEIREPDVCIDVIQNVFPKYRDSKKITDGEYRRDLNKINLAMRTDSSSRKESLVKMAIETPFIKAINNDNAVAYQIPSSVYFNLPDLRVFFSNTKSVWFLDKVCEDIIPNEIIIEFGVKSLPERILIDNISYIYHKNGIKDYKLDGLEDFLSMLGNFTTFEEQKEKSLLLWKTLKKKIENNHLFFYAEKYWFYYSQHHDYIISSLLQCLTDNKWIPVKSNTLESPKNITLSMLIEEINQDAELIKALNIPEKDSASIAQGQLEEKASELGVSLEDIEFIKTNSDEFRKFKESMSKIKNPIFPEGIPVHDPDRRRDKMAEKYADAEKKVYDIRPRRVRVSSIDLGEKKHISNLIIQMAMERWFVKFVKKKCPLKQEMAATIMSPLNY